jgi:hypothetical protein
MKYCFVILSINNSRGSFHQHKLVVVCISCQLMKYRFVFLSCHHHLALISILYFLTSHEIHHIFVSASGLQKAVSQQQPALQNVCCCDVFLSVPSKSLFENLPFLGAKYFESSKQHG